LLYTDFLKSTVLLAAAEGPALAAVTIAVAASQGDTTTILFAVSWWVIAVAIGVWLGRRAETTKAIGRLLASARTSNTLPDIRPGAVLLNRLWLLAVSAVLAAGLAWLFPQFSAVVAGGAFLVALAWRKQEPAVTAIEERDGVRYYVVPSSPFGAIELTRTPGLRRVTSVNGAGS
jgi:hypothetical protein